MSGKKSDENSYRNILKGISIFGGVKIFEIAVGIVRGKFVALFLGPGGWGVSSLLASAAAPIQQLASLGLNLAIVKEVAAHREDPHALARLIAVARRIIYITALFGALLTFLAAPWLSEFSFGDRNHTADFMLLSLMIFFAIAGAGKLSILQGLHEVKRLSHATLAGGIAGLVVGVPLYYFIGTRGIVPAMLATSLAIFIFYTFSLRRVTRSLSMGAEPFRWSGHRSVARRLVMLGLIMMSSDILGTLATYFTNAYVRWQGDLDTLGLFQAANSLTTQYAAVVFTVMSLDYFPRLAAIARDNRAMCDTVNRQTEIVGLMVAPLAAALIIFAPLVVRLLLADTFADSVRVMQWLALALTVKALMFPMGYITLAKDNRKLFFWMEGVGASVLTLAANCLFYEWFGLNGLGIGALVDCAVCLTVYYIVNRSLYGYRFSRKALLSTLYALVTTTAALLSSWLTDPILSYLLMSLILLLSAVHSLRALATRWRRRD